MQLKKREFDYKWVVLVVCFLMEFLCLGFCSSNAGLFTVSVTTALNIERDVYAVAGSIRYAVQVLVALNFGTLVKRFGIKKLVFVGLIAMIGAALIRSVGTQFYHFYIAGAFQGCGIVFVGGTMAGTIVRRWFHQDIGRYTGIVMSANGIGGAVAAPLLSSLINNGETFGYRKAYLLSAFVALGIGIVVMILIKERPAGSPVTEDTHAKKKPRGALWTGIEYNVAKKKPYFFVAAALIFLTGISLQSIGSITIVYMTDLGISTDFIAVSSMVSSLTLTVSKLLMGTAYDKRGLRFALLMGEIAGILTFVLKALLTNTPIGLVMAMTATIFSSIALPLETVMIPLLTNDLFGSASYNKVLGIFMAMNSLGLCLGTPLGEVLKKNFLGTYEPCFWLFSVLLVIVAVSFQFVITAANKEKKAILAKETA